MEDFMMVGLRLLEGVRSRDFIRQFGTSIEEAFGPVLEKLIGDKLLDRTPEGYKLPQHAVMYGNVVFGAFIGHLTI
ncbi:Oxygen-independent coproporphyrinogen-III oxidase 1 [compost metagenome]